MYSYAFNRDGIDIRAISLEVSYQIENHEVVGSNP